MKKTHRYTVTVSDEVYRAVERFTKKHKVSREKMLSVALSFYLQGFELLIMNTGTDTIVSIHSTHRHALTAMAGSADWHASRDLENRSFTGTKDGVEVSAKIINTQLPVFIDDDPAARINAKIEAAPVIKHTRWFNTDNQPYYD